MAVANPGAGLGEISVEGSQEPGDPRRGSVVAQVAHGGSRPGTERRGDEGSQSGIRGRSSGLVSRGRGVRSAAKQQSDTRASVRETKRGRRAAGRARETGEVRCVLPPGSPFLLAGAFALSSWVLLAFPCSAQAPIHSCLQSRK